MRVAGPVSDGRRSAQLLNDRLGQARWIVPPLAVGWPFLIGWLAGWRPFYCAGWGPLVGALLVVPLGHLAWLVPRADHKEQGGWRRWAPVEVLAECLAAAGLAAPVVGAGGGLRFSGELRAQATQEWLRAHPEVTAWVVQMQPPTPTQQLQRCQEPHQQRCRVLQQLLQQLLLQAFHKVHLNC
jgi:hypothetical protein